MINDNINYTAVNLACISGSSPGGAGDIWTCANGPAVNETACWGTGSSAAGSCGDGNSAGSSCAQGPTPSGACWTGTGNPDGQWIASNNSSSSSS